MGQRKHYTAEQKTIILRELLENNVPISRLCEKYELRANIIYKWKKKLFESAIDIFGQNNSTSRQTTSEELNISGDDLILRLLRYYTRQSLLAGYWRLAELLNERVKLIQQGVAISEFENQRLDYRNIAKLGNSFTIEFGNVEIQTFFNANFSVGFRSIVNNQQLFYALDKNIIDILETQNYESLITYIYRNGEEQTVVVNETNYFSINNDGSILGIVNRENLPLENRS